jgi:Glycosyl hydrolase family 47
VVSGGHVTVVVGQGDANVFETTIRVLGGLLATYEMRGTRVLLDRAVEVAQSLEVAFQT